MYIASKHPFITLRKEMAEALAVELYQYGQSLAQDKNQPTPKISEITLRKLTPPKNDAVDRFLAEESLYKSRKRQIEELTTADETNNGYSHETGSPINIHYKK